MPIKSELVLIVYSSVLNTIYSSYLGISNHVLGVSRWPDGEPLAGSRPCLWGWATGFPHRSFTQSPGSHIIWLPALLPKYTILSLLCYLSRCGCSARNGITWWSRVKLFVSKEQQTTVTVGVLSLASFPLSGYAPFALLLTSISLLFSSAHYFTHPPTPCIDMTEIEEVLGVSHWLPPSVLRPESWQPYYMTASSSSQVHYPVPLTLLVMLWM